MNKHIIGVTFVATLIGSIWAVEPQPSPSVSRTPTPTATVSRNGACRYNSWNPESYGFYGAKETLLGKLDKIPETAPFSERRVFVQITKGESKMEVKLFERQDDGKITVTQWTTDKKKIPCSIDESITDNKGLDCAGEKVKNLLMKLLGKGSTVESMTAPTSAVEAFSPAVNAATGRYIATIIILLC